MNPMRSMGTALPDDPRGPDVYAGPPSGSIGPYDINDITADEWAAFFQNVIWSDIRQRLIDNALSAMSLQQALYGMILGESEPWSNFNTSPLSLPINDAVVDPSFTGDCGSAGAAFTVQAGIRKVLL